MVIIAAVHHARVKLAELDVRIKAENFLSWPDGMATVRKKDGPEGGGLPNGENDDSFDVRCRRNFLPSGDELADGGRNEETFP